MATEAETLSAEYQERIDSCDIIVVIWAKRPDPKPEGNLDDSPAPGVHAPGPDYEWYHEIQIADGSSIRVSSRLLSHYGVAAIVNDRLPKRFAAFASSKFGGQALIPFVREVVKEVDREKRLSFGFYIRSDVSSENERHGFLVVDLLADAEKGVKSDDMTALARGFMSVFCSPGEEVMTSMTLHLLSLEDSKGGKVSW